MILSDKQMARLAQAPNALTMVHTHPSSSAPSLQDLQLMNKLNDDGGGTQLRTDRSVVVGADGSWYEIQLKRPMTPDEQRKVTETYTDYHEMLSSVAASQTDKVIAAALKITNKAGVFTTADGRSIDRDDAKVLAEHAGVDVLAVHQKHYNALSVKLWEIVQSEHADLIAFRHGRN